ncbi:MAG TPA: ABC transporter permease [Stellaceae bacterium]|nr:ABC transporter permease [Stellaceae bacterium]
MPRYVLRWLSPLAVLLLWELVGRSGLVNPGILPPLSSALADLGHLVANGELPRAMAVSLYRILSGFAIATVVGVALGASMARSPLCEAILDPLVELLRPISPLAILPLAILWFGFYDASKIFIIALSASFPIILNTYAGVRGIEPSLVRAAQSLGANRWEISATIILPSSLPQIFTGLRLAWGVSLIVMVAAEMVGSSNGIGYLVLEASTDLPQRAGLRRHHRHRPLRLSDGSRIPAAEALAPALAGMRRMKDWWGAKTLFRAKCRALRHGSTPLREKTTSMH